jgi:hypothetical protein
MAGGSHFADPQWALKLWCPASLVPFGRLFGRQGGGGDHAYACAISLQCSSRWRCARFSSHCCRNAGLVVVDVVLASRSTPTFTSWAHVRTPTNAARGTQASLAPRMPKPTVRCAMREPSTKKRARPPSRVCRRYCPAVAGVCQTGPIAVLQCAGRVGSAPDRLARGRSRRSWTTVRAAFVQIRFGSTLTADRRSGRHEFNPCGRGLWESWTWQGDPSWSSKMSH